MDPTSQLIETMVADAKPVQAASLPRLVGIWLAASVGFGTCYLALVGVRPDIGARLAEGRYWAALALWLFGYALASIWFLRQAIPGRLKMATGKGVALLIVIYSAALALYAGVGVHDHAHPELDVHQVLEAFGCCLRISLGTAGPMLLAIWMVTRLAPLELTRTLSFGLFAAGTIVSIVSQLNCPYEDAQHIIIGHGAMLVAVNAGLFSLYAGIARRSYKAAVRGRLGEKAQGLADRLSA